MPRIWIKRTIGPCWFCGGHVLSIEIRIVQDLLGIYICTLCIGGVAPPNSDYVAQTALLPSFQSDFMLYILFRCRSRKIMSPGAGQPPRSILPLEYSLSSLPRHNAPHSTPLGVGTYTFMPSSLKNLSIGAQITYNPSNLGLLHFRYIITDKSFELVIISSIRGPIRTKRKKSFIPRPQIGERRLCDQ